MDELLRVEDLTVALPTRSGYAKAVDGMSFAVDTGEVMGIAGESGSGKTITALSLFGLLPHGARVTGSIRLEGIELTSLSGKQLRQTRREIVDRSLGGRVGQKSWVRLVGIDRA